MVYIPLCGGTQQLCSHSETLRSKESMQTQSAPLSQASGKPVQPRLSYRPPASLFRENHLSEPESPVPTHPYIFPSVRMRLRRGAPGCFFPAPDRFFFLLSSAPAPLRRFPLGGQPQVPKRAPAGRPGAGHGGAARQGPSGRKSAASGAADWLSGWRLYLPPFQFQAAWRGIERLRDHGAGARRRL